MGKIKLKANLISEEENLNIETTGIKNKNKIIYKENNISVTIMLYNNKIEMKRECKEYKINLIFEKDKKSISTYNVFGAPKIFELETKTKRLEITDKKLELDYELEGSNFSYTLEMEDL